jgi:hypothetical protein
VPLINPAGIYLGMRSNGNGVDLMRNSPVEGAGTTRIYSGHPITPHLPGSNAAERLDIGVAISASR